MSSTHIPSEWESPWPRWAVNRRSPDDNLVADDQGHANNPLYAATRPVTTYGSLTSHLKAFESLLAKSWTRKEVEQAQARGFFRRLVPHLGSERLQGPTALLVACCARLHPPLLLPLSQGVCGVLPALLNSPRRDVRQAGLCLLGLLWKAAAGGPSQVQSQVLEAPRLLELLVARVSERDFDALWALRELATDARGAASLERRGALRALCAALRRLVKTGGGGGGGSGGGGKGGSGGSSGEEDGDKAAGKNRQRGQEKRQVQPRRQGTGVSASPGQTHASGLPAAAPPPRPAPPPAGRVGITAGGLVIEWAAEGVLVADCLAALTSVLPSAVAMCDERHMVPKHLVALLLCALLEPKDNKEDDVVASGPGASNGRDKGNGAGDGSTSGNGNRNDARDGDGRGAAPSGFQPAANPVAEGGDRETEGEGGSGGGEAEGSAAGDAGPRTGSSTGEQASDGSNSGGASQHGADVGTDVAAVAVDGDNGMAVADGAETADDGGAAAADGGDGSPDATGAVTTTEAEQRRVSERSARQQLQEAVLRSLHCLAACGNGKETQQLVQLTLREAGEPVIQALAAVLQGRQRLACCSAAAYLLWLTLAPKGDFSETELNDLRRRMAAEAPEDGGGDSGGGDADGGGGGGSTSLAGFGVVPAVSELLLRRLSGWRDADLPDCVRAVRTTVPPPEEATDDMAGALSGAGAAAAPEAPGSSTGFVMYGSGSGGGATAYGSSLQQQQQYASARGASSEGGGRGGRGGSSVGAPHYPVLQVGSESCKDSLETTLLRGLPPLRTASSTLLLTPRDVKQGPAPMVSPQRYSPDSSDEEEGAAAGGDGGGGADRRGESGGTGDPLSITGDLELSNVMDSSVELTGKEQIMRMIQEAGSALKECEEGLGEDADDAQQADPEAPPLGDESTPADGDDGDDAAASTAAAAAPGDPGAAAVPGPADSTSSAAASDGPPPSGSSPYGAPRAGSQQLDGFSPSIGVGAAASTAAADDSRGGPFAAARPTPLLLPSASLPRQRRAPVVVPSAATWLGAVRYVRQGRRRPGKAPPPAEVQELLASCVGLLSAVAPSAAGCRDICATPGLLPYITCLLDLPLDLPDSPAAAACSGGGLGLRLQLLALITNLSLHAEGAAAIAAATSSGGSSPLAVASGGPATMPEVLYGTARLSCDMIRKSSTSWKTGEQMLLPCFTIMSNMHRASVALNVDPDREPRDSYRLATEALSMPLPGNMGLADRTRLRAAAARMLDSATAVYEGVGRSVPPAVVSELLLLLGGGRPVPAAAGVEDRGSAGGGGGGDTIRSKDGQSAACDAAGALWQLMAGGMVHPEAVVSELQGPLISILRSARKTDSELQEADPDLRRAALGLVSCLARSELVSKRLWTSPLVGAVLRTHALARDNSWEPVAECAREVCQQLCRACHSEDRGSVSNTNKRVDRWGLTERMLTQLKCKLEFDYDEEAIMLVPLEE